MNTKYRREHQATETGNWFKVEQFEDGYYWSPVSCFLKVNRHGPFKTAIAAELDGKANYK